MVEVFNLLKMHNYKRKMTNLFMLFGVFCMSCVAVGAEVHYPYRNNHLHRGGPVGSCGQKTKAIRSKFRNPSFPETDTKEIHCHYTVHVNKAVCAIRLDLDVFELADFKSGGCLIDSMAVLGASGKPSTQFCGNMTNWSTTFEVDVPSKVVLVAKLSGTPPYRFSISITQVFCTQIVPFLSPNIGSVINTDAEEYDYSQPTDPPATEAPTEASDGDENENGEESTTSNPDVPTPLPTIGLPTRTPQDVILVVSSESQEFQPGSWLAESNTIVDTEEYTDYENPDGYDPDPVGAIPIISLYRKFFRGRECLSELEKKERKKCYMLEKKERERCLCWLGLEDETPHPSFYVVGGDYTNLNEYPWQVALVEGKKFFCGGSLISSRHILTAAHCIVGDTNITALRISLGDHDLSTRNETNHTVRNVSRIYWNLQYNPVTIMHDIAILEMDRPVEFSKTINPIRLPSDTSDLFDDEPEVITTGWGRYDNKKLATSWVLKEYRAPLLNMEDCIAKWKNVSKIPVSKERHTCLDISKGAPCHGDSGGPLITCSSSNTTCVQVGVVSFGHYECVDKGVPDVFTRVSHYTDWISMNLSPLAHFTYG